MTSLSINAPAEVTLAVVTVASLPAGPCGPATVLSAPAGPCAPVAPVSPLGTVSNERLPLKDAEEPAGPVATVSPVIEFLLASASAADAAAASAYMLNGANFVVTPVLREDIAMVCNRRKVLWSPGCGSLTEIAKAEELGAEIVKLVQGSTYGPGFVKGVLAPQPWTSIMPTGGVSPDPENLKRWFEAIGDCV